jgi:hypothetical protein
MGSLPTLVNKLKEINNNNLIDVFIPSHNKKIKFLPLSVKQQKDIIKSGVEGTTSVIVLNNIFNDIITKNSTEKKIYNILDRCAIILALRVDAFGSKFTNNSSIYDLSKIIKTELKQPDTTKVNYTYKDIINITLEVPTIEQDTAINTYLLDMFKKNEDTPLSEAIGSIYIYEILKYLTEVTVDDTEINFSALNSISTKISVLENLPAGILTDLIKFVQTFRDIESNYLTVDEFTLPLDARIFTQ